MLSLSAKAVQFKQLHDADETFIMANAWNAGSAVILQEAGIAAIGTTSAGLAYAQAVPDYADCVDIDTCLAVTQRIANAVQVPVSMDAENGYGHSPEDVFNNMQRIAATGVVGASIEDNCGDPDNPLYDLEQAVERVRSAKLATANLDYPFMLTARAECFNGSRKPLRRISRAG